MYVCAFSMLYYLTLWDSLCIGIVTGLAYSIVHRPDSVCIVITGGGSGGRGGGREVGRGGGGDRGGGMRRRGRGEGGRGRCIITALILCALYGVAWFCFLWIIIIQGLTTKKRINRLKIVRFLLCQYHGVQEQYSVSLCLLHFDPLT